MLEVLRHSKSCRCVYVHADIVRKRRQEAPSVLTFSESFLSKALRDRLILGTNPNACQSGQLRNELRHGREGWNCKCTKHKSLSSSYSCGVHTQRNVLKDMLVFYIQGCAHVQAIHFPTLPKGSSKCHTYAILATATYLR